jgi:hypothetical protein
MLTFLWTLTACNAGGGLTANTGVPPVEEPAHAALLTQVKPPTLPTDFSDLVGALQASETRQAALTELSGSGDDAVPGLSQVALEHLDLPTRGWAIQALAGIDGDVAGSALEQIQYGDVPSIVAAWAGAARIQRTDELYELLALADTAVAMPALVRPLELQARALADQLEDVSQGLEAMASGPSVLQAILAPTILARGPGELVDAMFSHPNDQARRLAAGLLGTLDQQQDGVGSVVAAAYAPSGDAAQTLWQGGALYVPALKWGKADARLLVGHLISWHVYCNEQGLDQEKNQIRNNLNSIQLLEPAGYNRRSEWPESDTVALVAQWGRIHGTEAARQILRPWGLEDSPKYGIGR